jgi:hypothetical protein
MTKITSLKTEQEEKPEVKNPFKDAYNELNESKKAVLRADFINEMDYKSFDSFYRKLRNPEEVYKNEKKWFAEKMGLTVAELFPEEAATK